jgi:predicted nucleic acid-binding protein
LVDISNEVLELAAKPLPSPLKTLDSIHLATALLWRDANKSELVFATHDEQLARAARALNFQVLGVPTIPARG